MKMNKKEIGLRIRRVRKNLGLTQEEVSEKVGITLQQYGKIERGESGTLSRTIYEIAKALNTSLNYIVFGKEEEQDNDEIHDLIKRLAEYNNFDDEIIVRKFLKYFDN